MDDKIVSPKIEIINNFDNLVNRVDIDIEECLEKYKQKHLLGDQTCYKSYKKNEMMTVNTGYFELNESYKIEQSCFKEAKNIEELIRRADESNENFEDLQYNKIYKTVDLWSESTKVVDYLNQVRTRTIEELRKAQVETLGIYQSREADSDSKSQLFPDKFYFQVRFSNYSVPEEWIFRLFTFVTDFYMSTIDIDLLEELINARKDDYDLFIRDNETIFDEKMILIGLLQKHFFENLRSEKFPSHVISVRKQDLLNIKQISSSYNVNGVHLTNSTSSYLSNLGRLDIDFFSLSYEKQIYLDGLTSLESLCLRLDSLERLSLRNLPALRHLELTFVDYYRIDSRIHSLLDNLPNIEYLALHGFLCGFNLDSLVKLKSLSLSGPVWKELFNFDLLKNICNQLEELSIGFIFHDFEGVTKFFFDKKFPNIKTFNIGSNSYKIEKKIFNLFPMLQNLHLHYSVIDQDFFSKLGQLTCLDFSNFSIKSSIDFSYLINLRYLNLSRKWIKSIDVNIFSNLTNLRALDLSYNGLKVLDAKIFRSMNRLIWLNLNNNRLLKFDLCILDYIKEIREISLLRNRIVNKEEILAHIKDSEIEFKI